MTTSIWQMLDSPTKHLGPREQDSPFHQKVTIRITSYLNLAGVNAPRMKGIPGAQLSSSHSTPVYSGISTDLDAIQLEMARKDH